MNIYILNKNKHDPEQNPESPASVKVMFIWCDRSFDMILNVSPNFFFPQFWSVFERLHQIIFGLSTAFKKKYLSMYLPPFNFSFIHYSSIKVQGLLSILLKY
jgi:hypothetical protein